MIDFQAIQIHHLWVVLEGAQTALSMVWLVEGQVWYGREAI